MKKIKAKSPEKVQIFINDGNRLHNVKDIINSHGLSPEKINVKDLKKWVSGGSGFEELSAINEKNEGTIRIDAYQQHSDITLDDLKQYIENVRDDASVSLLRTDRGADEIISFTKSLKNQTKETDISSSDEDETSYQDNSEYDYETDSILGDEVDLPPSTDVQIYISNNHKSIDVPELVSAYHIPQEDIRISELRKWVAGENAPMEITESLEINGRHLNFHVDGELSQITLNDLDNYITHFGDDLSLSDLLNNSETTKNMIRYVKEAENQTNRGDVSSSGKNSSLSEENIDDDNQSSSHQESVFSEEEDLSQDELLETEQTFGEVDVERAIKHMVPIEQAMTATEKTATRSALDFSTDAATAHQESVFSEQEDVSQNEPIDTEHTFGGGDIEYMVPIEEAMTLTNQIAKRSASGFSTAAADGSSVTASVATAQSSAAVTIPTQAALFLGGLSAAMATGLAHKNQTNQEDKTKSEEPVHHTQPSGYNEGRQDTQSNSVSMGWRNSSQQSKEQHETHKQNNAQDQHKINDLNDSLQQNTLSLEKENHATERNKRGNTYPAKHQHQDSNQEPEKEKNIQEEQQEENLNPFTRQFVEGQNLHKEKTQNSGEQQETRHYNVSDQDNDIRHTYPTQTKPAKTDVVQEILQEYSTAIQCQRWNYIPDRLVQAETLRQDYAIILGPDALWGQQRFPHAVEYIDWIKQGEECVQKSPVIDLDWNQEVIHAKDYAVTLLSIGAIYIVLNQPEIYPFAQDAMSQSKKLLSHILFGSQPVQDIHSMQRDLKNIASNTEWIYMNSDCFRVEQEEEHFKKQTPYDVGVDVTNTITQIIARMRTFEDGDQNINNLHIYAEEFCDDIFV